MSSNFKLAATTAVLLSTLSFTATAGDTKYFADVTPESYALEQFWDIEALARFGDDDRLILEIGGLAEDNTYIPSTGGGPEQLITDCVTDEEETNLIVCTSAVPFRVILRLDPTGANIRKVYTTDEVVFEDDPDKLCGGAGIVLREDNGDAVPSVQPGDRVTFRLLRTQDGRIGRGTFSEDEPAEALPANGNCPAD
ncbi:hypothetical protein [Photobacterium rosenbergii]|uniref:hypothetical protein n=1 Tax=Photobacterium rosenbergii TaxID=294936 RepID=UPI001C9A068A|nr:hypothetical protein [Photobacterium rosenbergii]MBY5945753.1 hypothetical protein [Photobacterium rosenbergii]